MEAGSVATDARRARGGPAPLLAEWAQAHRPLAAAWVKDHGDAVALWLNEQGDAVKDKPDEPAGASSQPSPPPTPRHLARERRGEDAGRNDAQVIGPATRGAEIQSAFFPAWWQANPNADLEPVPADMVMTSASGLDPDITLKAALYSARPRRRRMGRADRPRKGRARSEIEQDTRRTGPGAVRRPGRREARQCPGDQPGAVHALREGQEPSLLSRNYGRRGTRLARFSFPFRLHT